jgi:uncharacterized protein (DUF885 family)
MSGIDVLAHEFWEHMLQAHPTMATVLGDRRFDAAMPDPSPAGMEAESRQLEELEARVGALGSSSLSPAERITAETLLGEIRTVLAHIRSGLWLWTVDPLAGPQVDLMNLALLQTAGTPKQGSDMVQRWRAMGLYLDAFTSNLRQGLAEGKVATREATARAVRQLEELVASPVEHWTLFSPLKQPHPDWSEAESVRPAFERYLRCVRDEVLPRARPDERVGLACVPGGEAAYRDLIRAHTSLELTAQEIHDFGTAELERIRQEMRELGSRVLGTDELGTILARLREDPALFFGTREEVREYAEQSLHRAQEAMPRWFARLPKASCEVRAIEPYEEKDATIAYYRQPATDGSRPGTYYVNTYAPETRPRYEAQALAFHESVPGHHLQIAIAQELEDIPEFRRHVGVTAYVEGWALYTERLSDEMGLYSGDLDRIGMLSFDAWRAARLVVDTGMHALGWSRQRAIDFMVASTALARNNIENEVDRYITWPGQALSYKLGQREMWRLRRRAEERLGSRFDIRAFHDRVLENGAVSLPLLAQLVEEWIDAQLVGA